jgi:DNA repair exonuclease SbcCD ATPase subunit
LNSISERKDELEGARLLIKQTGEELKSHSDAIAAADENIKESMQKLGVKSLDDLPIKEELITRKNELNGLHDDIVGRMGSLKQQLEDNEKNIAKRNEAEKELLTANQVLAKWDILNSYFGGTRFRTLVQTYVLRPLLNNANIYLEKITDRYKLTCSEENDQLSILVHDLYNKGQVRSATILSGGERFMISLALSLALSSLNRPDMNVNILFIDEGFGTLDENNLNSVMSTLEKLQEIAGQSNRRVGIISHREELEERIPVKIMVKKHGEGRSMIEMKYE